MGVLGNSIARRVEQLNCICLYSSWLDNFWCILIRYEMKTNVIFAEINRNKFIENCFMDKIKCEMLTFLRGFRVKFTSNSFIWMFYLILFTGTTKNNICEENENRIIIIIKNTFSFMNPFNRSLFSIDVHRLSFW